MPSSSAITGFGLPKASSMPTFICVGVAPLSRSTRAAWAMACSWSSTVTAMRQDFRIPGGVRRKRASRHEPFRFERENAIGGRNPHARRRVGGAIRGAGDLPDELHDRRRQALAGGHVARVIARLSHVKPEPLFETWRLKDEPCVSRRNQLTASYRCSCRADWSLIPLVRITGIRPSKRVRKPGTQPVEALHVVHRKGARAAWTREVNYRYTPPAIPDHRVQNPAGIDRSLYFPIMAALKPASSLQMQKPADANRAKSRPKS